MKEGILIWLGIIALACSYGLGAKVGAQKAEKSLLTDFPTKTDTLLVRDTIVEREPVYLTRTRTETVTDTLYLKGDTVKVEVEVPVSHERAEYPEADVWYHGYRAGIDSLRVYPVTRVITNTVTVDRYRDPSKWSFGISGGYGIGKGGLTPYIGVGLTYDLVRLPKLRWPERIDYD